MKPTIIFVAGHPATGKTTLARKIADELSLPFLSKDETLKEPMFDTFETTSREWSVKIGKVSYKIMEYLIEQQLKAGYGVVVESTFKHEFDNPTFQRLQREYKYDSIQIICHTELWTLAKRFVARIESGERHPGHGEIGTLEETHKYLDGLGKVKPFDIEGKVMEIDTTYFSQVDHDTIIKEVKTYRH